MANTDKVVKSVARPARAERREGETARQYEARRRADAAGALLDVARVVSKRRGTAAATEVAKLRSQAVKIVGA